MHPGRNVAAHHNAVRAPLFSTMSRRRASSQRWLAEHRRDAYVRRAHVDGLRSRASFKLSELDDRYRIFRPAGVVVDLGAAPGGWSQIAVERVAPNGVVIALDILPMTPLEGVTILQADFREPEGLAALEEALQGRSVNCVLSDIAPNMSGMRAVDQPRSMYLAELALDFARGVLEPGGTLLVKVFQGEGFDALLAAARTSFDKVIMRKPDASRARSREQYLLGQGYRPADG